MYSLKQVNWEATADKNFRGEDKYLTNILEIF